MSKGTFSAGQPVFNQLLSFIPEGLIGQIVSQTGADRYCKKLKTYDHLVAMLFAVYNQCTTLREVTMGMQAWEQRLAHIGLKFFPRRSTLSDANARRSAEVFEKIYMGLLQHYKPILPDSRKQNKKNNLYIFDSTSITLFKEILKGSGIRRKDGRNKGGIKVHTLLDSNRDVPVMVRYSAATDNDSTFLKQVHLSPGSVVVFDRGYNDFKTFNRFTADKITFVTRKRAHWTYNIEERRTLSDEHKQAGIKCDWNIVLGYDYLKKANPVRGARLVKYKDPLSGKAFEFITNNRRLSPKTIAKIYEQRWQIETFFKRIKQNYPLQYFLGDNENAIKIQIWCALIADLILKVIKQGSKTRMAFSNLTGLIRIHLMTYLDLQRFFKHSKRALVNTMRQRKINIQYKINFEKKGAAPT